MGGWLKAAAITVASVENVPASDTDGSDSRICRNLRRVQPQAGERARMNLPFRHFASVEHSGITTKLGQILLFSFAPSSARPWSRS